LPSRRLSTMAVSVEKGVNNAPSMAVTGREEILPGSCWRQIRAPLLAKADRQSCRAKKPARRFQPAFTA
jgi:hypothetical protein